MYIEGAMDTSAQLIIASVNILCVCFLRDLGVFCLWYSHNDIHHDIQYEIQSRMEYNIQLWLNISL